jgi:hypothetical protein
MPEKTAFETGARKYPARTGPDPSDDFSQNAAGNKPPGKGEGLVEKVDKKKKREWRSYVKEGPRELSHASPPPRDTRGAPVPNPNVNSG